MNVHDPFLLATRALNEEQILIGGNMTEETQGNNTRTTETTGKTFTQEEVNAIVGDRLTREREKYADYETLKEKASKFDQSEEKNKTELQKQTEKAEALQKELDAMKKRNTIRDMHERVAKEIGVPSNLLSGDDEETCKSQAKAILEFVGKKKGTYPNVKDGGENNNTSTMTKKEILEIKDEKARLKAIQEHIDLF